MTKNRFCCGLALILVFAASAGAQDAPNANSTGGRAKLLERALKLYPDADTDGDGKLSIGEAMAYVEQHPELKAMLAQQGLRIGGEAAPKTTRPGLNTTRTVAGLPEGPRVFVCAHSFMIFTGQWLPQLTEAAGIAYRDAGTQMIGGSPTLRHWNVPDEHNLAKQVLRQGDVDVLMVSPHIFLPDEGIDRFVRLGLEHQPNLRIHVQASWPARDGRDGTFTNDQRDAMTVEDLMAQQAEYETAWLRPLESQIDRLNQSLARPAVSIVPVGNAVNTLRQRIAKGEVPGITQQSQLFRDDLGHTHPPLAALVSYCHFAVIHQRSPIGLSVPRELSGQPQAESLNRILQETAWDAVRAYPRSGLAKNAIATP